MDVIDTTKLLSPAEQTQFAAIAKKHGMQPADLAEIAVKQALYTHINLNGPANPANSKRRALAK